MNPSNDELTIIVPSLLNWRADIGSECAARVRKQRAFKRKKVRKVIQLYRTDLMFTRSYLEGYPKSL